MKNFAMTGVAGYIAPRHLEAIKNTGNNLIAAVDPHDSVGILDRYFPDASFFTEIERFDRHLEKLRRKSEEERAHYLSICSPNHLHDAHIRLALRLDTNAICEKPLVLKPSNLDALEKLEEETGKKVNCILQLRVHEALLKLKKKLDDDISGKRKKVILTYITSRGPWYNYSWKGDQEKSGGVVCNIGIHFFDLLLWYFGKSLDSRIYLNEKNKMSGRIELERADVRWFLSIDRSDLPQACTLENRTTYRSITIDGEEVEFTKGFTDLHTKVYEEILKGKGFGIDVVRPSIELAYSMRTAKIVGKPENPHPFLETLIEQHK
ncbi:Gfo/Idh/MocA family oxidoreductase [candidate division WOR-3 bacterium]|nr:Gfo/Idh/MocA family oxidoreductase [candidate division WOR-3 bacterium]